MRVSILFCAGCDYEPRAVGLAAAVRERFHDAEIELVPSDDDEFRVKCDDDPVFDKSEAGRLPEPEEVLALLGRQASSDAEH